MADDAAGSGEEGEVAGGQGGLNVFGTLNRLARRTDILFALGIIGILVVLILPLPASLLDFLLGLSLTCSVLVLMTVLFVEKPLQLSSFPTILLIVTMLRLSLNIASTRLILAHGHEGTAAAGQVIEAFGGFVMGSSVIIGAIIFGILTIINFMVITKGSGRIAEVSARFSLDAMPGKQMAIDADLSAGLIDEDTARTRRKSLEDESNFYGAMDGASKFVRGDAVAGLLITFINFIAGILIGVAQNDMSFSAALDMYTALTIGDGLVSQIPALVVSTGAGILVTKAGVAGSAEKAVLGQLGRNPTPLGLTSGALFCMGLLPGIPMLPFMLLSGLVGYGAYYLIKNPEIAERFQDLSDGKKPAGAKGGDAAQADGSTKEAGPGEENNADFLQIDSLRLEMGYGLLPLINYSKGHRLTEQIKALRRQVAREYGFIIPAIRIQDNMQLPSNGYSVKVKEIEVSQGEIRPDMLLIMNPTGDKIQLPGEETVEPTFGLPAMWIAENYREEALFRNYTVVDPPTVITTHLTEIIKDNMADLLSYAETQKLLDDLGKSEQKLISEMIPSQISVTAVQRVLQNLLKEQVSIRDLPTIMEGIAEMSSNTNNVLSITEHVRTQLARQISHACTTDQGYIPILSIPAEWEQIFSEALTGDGDKTLSLAPSQVQDFIQLVRKKYDEMAAQGEVPVLLTSPIIRPYVRSIMERFRADTQVLSQNEIHPRARIKTFGTL